MYYCDCAAATITGSREGNSGVVATVVIVFVVIFTNHYAAHTKNKYVYIYMKLARASIVTVVGDVIRGACCETMHGLKAPLGRTFVAGRALVL